MKGGRGRGEGLGETQREGWEEGDRRKVVGTEDRKYIDKEGMKKEGEERRKDEEGGRGGGSRVRGGQQEK